MREAGTRRGRRMAGMGLVASVEKQLEQDIVLRRLPHGKLSSERKMARVLGVSRGTVREALRRLGARGLVEQRSGRQARVVTPELSLTLENLGMALHEEGSSEGRWLLEGYFSLKRQVLVELLVDCCAKGTEEDLRELRLACFRLRDAGRWEESGERCARLEFELLRLAARVADRPGHLLLVQSLQWALWGSAARLLPFMGGRPVGEWACCAMQAIGDRDVEALRQTLPPLLMACDEDLLARFAPGSPRPGVAESVGAPSCQLEAPVPEEAQDVMVRPCPCVEPSPSVAQDLVVEASPRAEVREPGPPVAAAGDTVIPGEGARFTTPVVVASRSLLGRWAASLWLLLGVFPGFAGS
jgi:GntR family transcriptional regulator, transcriptional repressor for pyruvate dehydrogenase complex